MKQLRLAIPLALFIIATMFTACEKQPEDDAIVTTEPMATEQTESVCTEETEEATEETESPTTEATLPEWDGTILGKSFDPAATVIDLTDVIGLAEGQKMGDKTAYEIGLKYRTMGTQEPEPKTAKIQYANPLPDKREQTRQLIEEVEAAMAYVPEAETVLMSGAWLDNEAMAQFRERNRDNYKVVWSVQCGDMAVRTDATFFMPTKFHVKEYAFSDECAYNLRYCEDMICIDVGHMKITNVDFAAFMPELKYLIITLTHVYDVTPLANCKKLVFLEMDWSLVADYSPLVECTALEDLNIGQTYGDVEDILEMTWLKNLWLVGMKNSNYEKVVAALPDTNIGYFYNNPDDGWRRLPNYYAMRDALYMYYMD